MRNSNPLLLALSCISTLAFGAALAVAAQPSHHASSATKIAPGDVPLNLAETPDGFIVSTNSGYSPHYLQAYDLSRHQVSDRLKFPSLWYGLAYDAGSRLVLASTGGDSVSLVPFEAGKFGQPREARFDNCVLTAGLEIVRPWVAVTVCNQNGQAIKFDFRSGRVLERTKVGEYPYAVKALPGDRLAVSLWGQSSVAILDEASLKTIRTIRVGSHPSDMAVLPDRNQLLVACSDSDLISVIDLKTLSEVRRVDIRLPNSALGGAEPDALAFDRSTGRLYAALAAIDSLAVFEMEKSADAELKFDGLVPVGAYPTALLYSSRHKALYIADGRNPVTGPSSPTGAIYHPAIMGKDWVSSSGSKLTYVGNLVGGGIEQIPDADFARLRSAMSTLAAEVYGSHTTVPPAQWGGNIRYFSAKSNPDNPIHHVIYIIKENRTYDQVLGDVKEGNADPGLTLFGEAVTPNQHALARQFVLYDNFFVDGDVSADGHLWSTTAEATDYISKLWPSTYSHQIRMDIFGAGYNGDDQHDHPIAVPASGFIWDLAAKAGISYRDYGEWCVEEESRPGVVTAYVKGLKGHFDPQYLDGIGEITDQKRIDEWQREFREFEKSGDLPRLMVLHVPNDHTQGTRPGSFTPRAMVADNDLAVGRLVESVSHSRFWPSTAILVLEDDAQDGPDHVDAHRSTLLAISPYVKHHALEHARFSTVSVLKTIEQLLGLPSLTYFDDRASSLLEDFQKKPLLDSYTAVRPRVSLDETNAPNAPGAKESSKWDFTHPDAAPEQALNRVIWQSVKGPNSEPPPPVFSVRSAAQAGARSMEVADH